MTRDAELVRRMAALAAFDGYAELAIEPPDATFMPFSEATVELSWALQRGDLIGSGKLGSSTRRPMDTVDWEERAFYIGGNANWCAVLPGLPPANTNITDILLPSADVLRLWPAIQTGSDKGGVSAPALAVLQCSAISAAEQPQPANLSEQDVVVASEMERTAGRLPGEPLNSVEVWNAIERVLIAWHGDSPARLHKKGWMIDASREVCQQLRLAHRPDSIQKALRPSFQTWATKNIRKARVRSKQSKP